MDMSSHPCLKSEELHVARSRCIDAFAKMEYAIVGVSELLESEFRADQFGQRIEQLRKIPASSRLSKDCRKQLHELLERCDRASQIRNDLVHAAMQSVKIDGALIACFVNARKSDPLDRIARLLRADDLTTAADQWSQLADAIQRWRPKPNQAL